MGHNLREGASGTEYERCLPRVAGTHQGVFARAATAASLPDMFLKHLAQVPKRSKQRMLRAV
jgi:hypothetical protein